MLALRLVTLALLSITAQASRTSATASARAKQWMTDNPDQAGLNDLKGSDPNAFAIVQALLAKQQLGLLDPKHPTANFAKKQGDDDEQESAADIMRAAPTIDVGSGAMPVSEMAVSEPVHHTYSSGSMWNYKQHKTDEDDAMVQSVLGTVAQIAPVASSSSTHSLLTSRRSTSSTSDSAMNGDMAAFGFGGQHSMATSEAQDDQRPAPVAPRRQSGSSGFGMPTMEWGNRYAGTPQKDQPQPAAVPASMSQQTSHLRAAAKPVAQPAPVVESMASNPYLSGIDFSGDVPAKPKASMAQRSLVTRKPTQAELASNPYLDGINFDNKSPAAEQPQVEAPHPVASMAQKRSYLSQIDFPGHHAAVAVREVPKPGTANGLTTFSWGQMAQAAAQPDTEMMQKVEEGVTQAKLSGTLSDWLNPSAPAPPKVAAVQIVAPAATAEDANAVDPMAMDKYNDWVKAN